MPGNEKIKGCGFQPRFYAGKRLTVRFYSEGIGFVERFYWGHPLRRTVLLKAGDGKYFEVSQGEPDHDNGGGVALRLDDYKAAAATADRVLKGARRRTNRAFSRIH